MTKELKLPPQAKEIEANVLGVLLVVPNTADVVMRNICVNDFYAPLHQIIYKAMWKLNMRGEALDYLTVFQQINANGDKVELYELTKLTNSVIGSQYLDSWLRLIKEKSLSRQIIKETSKYNDRAYTEDQAPNEILGDLLSSINKIMQSQQSKTVETFQDVMTQAVKQMQEAAKVENAVIGITTSINSLDKITLGFSAPDLIILAAGPGEGKSTLMLNAAKAAALSGKKVCVFSLEMRNYQLMLKIFSSELDIEVSKLRSGKLTTTEWQELTALMLDKLAELQIFMNDIGGLSIIELISIVRSLKVKEGIDIVFVDYLLLLNTTGCGERFGTREEKVNYISKQLKALAMDLNIPVVALTQLSRIKEKRMYQLNDLRESGAIEQDADMVLFVYRPKYNKIDNDSKGNAYTDEDAFVIIEKNRLGATGLVPVRFKEKFNRFEDKSASKNNDDYNF